MNVSEKEKSVKYKELYYIFEKIFRSKNYGQEDFFQNDVFFLSDDIEFKKLCNIKNTPNTNLNDNNILYQILENNSENGSDFKKLKIQVGIFIKHLILNLIELQNQKDIIVEKIKSFDIDETLNIIEQKLYNIKISENQNPSNPRSSMKISVSRLDCLPDGDYVFKLYLQKFTIRDRGVIQKEDVVNSNLPMVNIKNRIIDLKERYKEFTFESHKIFPVDINYNEFKNDDTFLKQYSGTNLLYFKLEMIDKQGNIFSTSPQEILDLFLKLVNTFFTDFIQNSKEISIKLPLKKEEPIKDEKSCSFILLNVQFEIDPVVRKSILERIYYIFKNIISFRTLVENNQHDLLNHFPYHSDQIINILSKQMAEENSNCDCGCLIF